jgi:uracil-DNA glycosylase family 4
VSDIDYKKLRAAQKEMARKGTFPFPTYAEALFSQVLVTRRPIESAFGKTLETKTSKKPISVPGPQVASSREEVSKDQDEKKSMLQSLGRFVSESGGADELVSFKGGELKTKSTGNDLVINEAELVTIAHPRIVDTFNTKTQILFVGECPKDYDSENPYSDLLSKMIAAMKIGEGAHCRVFITKDSEVAEQEWFGLLKEIPRDVKELIIVSLGALSTNTILQKKERLSKIHGKEFNLMLKRGAQELQLKVFPVFHPDILQINPNMKRSAWLDLQKVMEFLP